MQASKYLEQPDPLVLVRGPLAIIDMALMSRDAEAHAVQMARRKQAQGL